MGKCNQLFQDDCERRAREWLAEHPECDEADAYDALFGNEPDEPAQAIETRSATTENTGVARKGESAVPKECAPKVTP